MALQEVQVGESVFVKKEDGYQVGKVVETGLGMDNSGTFFCPYTTRETIQNKIANGGNGHPRDLKFYPGKKSIGEEGCYAIDVRENVVVVAPGSYLEKIAEAARVSLPGKNGDQAKRLVFRLSELFDPKDIP